VRHVRDPRHAGEAVVVSGTPDLQHPEPVPGKQGRRTKCADIESPAQKPGANAVGARVVIGPCDGTPSQQWDVLFATGNQSQFKNALIGLFITNNNGNPVLEASSAKLPSQGRAQQVQIFGSTFVNVE
jgi:hypothetical protein